MNEGDMGKGVYDRIGTFNLAMSDNEEEYIPHKLEDMKVEESDLKEEENMNDEILYRVSSDFISTNENEWLNGVYKDYGEVWEPKIDSKNKTKKKKKRNRINGPNFNYGNKNKNDCINLD